MLSRLHRTYLMICIEEIGPLLRACGVEARLCSKRRRGRVFFHLHVIKDLQYQKPKPQVGLTAECDTAWHKTTKSLNLGKDNSANRTCLGCTLQDSRSDAPARAHRYPYTPSRFSILYRYYLCAYYTFGETEGRSLRAVENGFGHTLTW
jgi:hypothetical protein